ncbi:amidohydrolase [Novosphingobium sp.]|uniref:amidohydrolase family protein n=1 Tax=Novosphingobium sp. TaxID=1874826 RepID=UPI0035B2EEC8
MTEAILEPDLPIIDPHHHLWDLRPLLNVLPDPDHHFIAAIARSPYYTFNELYADATCGHNVIGTVFMECGAFYRQGAGDDMKVLGETEYVNGVAAQSASGLYGDIRLCDAIIGHVDLQLGDGARKVLEAQMAVTNRFKGIRHTAPWDADPTVLGSPFHAPRGLYRDATFRQGFRHLGELGLTFDAWLLEPQLEDVLDLARAFPDQPICLDHCGTPLGMGKYHGKLHERFDVWRKNIQEIAKCPNVVVKLGGLAMSFAGMPDHGPEAGLSSETLAAMWRPYIETCIEAFGPERGMFESNYPVDKWGASYAVLWNAFKHLTVGASADEKRALYAGTAAKFYGMEHLLA